MDKYSVRLLLIIEEGNFISLVSIGDIQRAILKNISLSTKVENILRSKIEVANSLDDIEKIKSEMLATRTECMPIIDINNRLIDVVFWEDLFADKYSDNQKLTLPVIIMAGGIGSRLKPLTNVIPKPLLPIGQNTIIEEIMTRFKNIGSNEFYISVNYKADIIEHYLKSIQNNSFIIKFIHEKKPLGTAGSLHLLKGKIDTSFFVSNCDILINHNYIDFYRYHVDNMNDITIIAALKHYPISYGTIETGMNGDLLALIEKPELTFKINTGMYLLEPRMFDYIPDNECFHITELISAVKNAGGRIGVFPISQGSWKDIGERDEYLSVLNWNQ